MHIVASKCTSILYRLFLQKICTEHVRPFGLLVCSVTKVVFKMGPVNVLSDLTEINTEYSVDFDFLI